MQIAAKFATSESLSARLERTVADVKKAPNRIDLRVALFQFFCLQGKWDRALTQLNVISDMGSGPEIESFVRAYDTLIGVERFRESVFAGKKLPLLLGEPEPWIALLFEAAQHDAAGRHEAAATLRDQAFETAPASAVRINDELCFDWIADADSRFGPMLEACLGGKYYWIPFNRLTAISIDAPQDLRDFVWLPAQLTFSTGGSETAFLPVRYPGSAETGDEVLQLARRTDWLPLHGDYYRGLGQHTWTGGEQDIGLLDVRSLTFAAV